MEVSTSSGSGAQSCYSIFNSIRLCGMQPERNRRKHDFLAAVRALCSRRAVCPTIQNLDLMLTVWAEPRNAGAESRHAELKFQFFLLRLHLRIAFRVLRLYIKSCHIEIPPLRIYLSVSSQQISIKLYGLFRSFRSTRPSCFIRITSAV